MNLEAYFSKNPGWAEQNADYYWESLSQACQDLWAQNIIKPEQIKGVSLTTQRYTMINLDAVGRLDGRDLQVFATDSCKLKINSIAKQNL